MKTDLLVTKVTQAKLAIVTAETNLENALSEIRSAPRAQKIAISEVLEDAFDRLRSAQAALAELERLLIEEAP